MDELGNATQPCDDRVAYATHVDSETTSNKETNGITLPVGVNKSFKWGEFTEKNEPTKEKNLECMEINPVEDENKVDIIKRIENELPEEIRSYTQYLESKYSSKNINVTVINVNAKEIDPDRDKIISDVVKNPAICFKSQQLDEEELPLESKRKIAESIFDHSKANFLSRFGPHLKPELLNCFDKYVDDEKDGYDIKFHLQTLRKVHTRASKLIKNRRFEAIKRLTHTGTYFSEVEMMRRNPLLYHQLIGQYLTDEEKKERDNLDTKNITLVNLLLESMDRDRLKQKQKCQQEAEEAAMEEEDTDSEMDVEDARKNEEEGVDKTTKWGEMDRNVSDELELGHFSEDETLRLPEPPLITADERKLLRDEFISIMHQHFLDGKDDDFDYTSVDFNTDYDSIEIRNQDEEESYFESESPAEMHSDGEEPQKDENEDSEDELDTFMSRLNQHPAVVQLSKDIEKM